MSGTGAREYNFDGLVGPTHNYAGLAKGNLASQENRGLVSHPKEAALQGLEKMRLLMRLGVPQGVLPPQERPNVWALRGMGFNGDDAAILARVAREAPEVLAACGSASAMWAANAAMVSASADCADGRVHMTAANLISSMHRSIEAGQTDRTLKTIFRGERFVHHGPVPAAAGMGDEGAANHTRLCGRFGEAGVEIFAVGPTGRMPERFPARQSRAASEMVARQHLLNPARTFFIQQNPEAIDAGAFHTDVVAVGHRQVMVYHERAFVDGAAIMGKVRERVEGFVGVRVPESVLPLADAVRSYFFNSQLVTAGDGGLAFIVPAECEEIAAARAALAYLRERVDVAVQVVDVRQSMRNGGGPACLRLRVEMTTEEAAGVVPGVLLTEELYEKLRVWVGRHYRDELRPEDLADPSLLEESRRALDELTGILGLPGLYEFQRA